MKLFPFVSVLVAATVSVLGQTIELGAPTNGAVLHRGKNFTAQVIQPESLASCIQVGIALAINNCNNGVCPQPTDQLGDVLYAGPWNPTPHNPTPHSPPGFYQNFTLQVPDFLNTGPAIFTLTHLCLLGAAPFPFLEFRNATVRITK